MGRLPARCDGEGRIDKVGLLPPIGLPPSVRQSDHSFPAQRISAVIVALLFRTVDDDVNAAMNAGKS
jgi:hypothetical protein